MNTNDALFYTSLYTFLGAFIIGITGLLYKSKCKKVSCCGVCQVERDIETELAEDTLEIQQRHNPTHSIDRPTT